MTTFASRRGPRPSIPADDAAQVLAAKDDPRLTTALARRWATPRFIAQDADGEAVQAYWQAIVDTLPALGDARAKPALDRLVPRIPRIFREHDAVIEMNTGRPLAWWLRRALSEIELPAPAPLSPDDEARCAALEHHGRRARLRGRPSRPGAPRASNYSRAVLNESPAGHGATHGTPWPPPCVRSSRPRCARRRRQNATIVCCSCNERSLPGASAGAWTPPPARP